MKARSNIITWSEMGQQTAQTIMVHTTAQKKLNLGDVGSNLHCELSLFRSHIRGKKAAPISCSFAQFWCSSTKVGDEGGLPVWYSFNTRSKTLL